MTGPRLRLLDGVAWEGRSVPGDRTRALLRRLAAADGHPVSEASLTEAIWPENRPANPDKALQVVVSRARKATCAEAVARAGTGYRLALARDDVETWLVRDAAARARRALADGDPASAEADARRVHAAGQDTEGLLGRVHAAAGRHEDALPLLEAAAHTDEVLLALLRSEAAVRGVPAALARYDRYRTDVADRLGVDLAPELHAMHRELLARDRPVRTGVRYEASSLLGRADDVEALTGLLRQARVVTILGPGGLGKTRLAQVLAGRADQPAVHVVELVGVTADEDVLAEVAAALGVRDSVSSRRLLTREQRADVRARVADHLFQVPTLLVLDNCEHLVDAVAELTAFLVSAVPELTVLTTSRTPLAIAAERVYPLGQLGPGDAAALFAERATAARPGARLPADTVRGIVDRLDGLPLAVELAAAKVRAMSVEEILRRLTNRFDLLRGGDRTAPDRHQTLLAVIDWSWNLLAERERRALRRLSVYQDGFSLEAAEAMVGAEAVDAVAELVDASLLTVSDAGTHLRYRMLETVREFGRMQLVGAGEEDVAREQQRRWAVTLAERESRKLYGPDQLAAIDLLALEDANLSDVLRQAFDEPDPATVVPVFVAVAGLGGLRGDQPRGGTFVMPLAEVLEDFTPPSQLADLTRAALALGMFAALVGATGDRSRLHRILDRLGSHAHDPSLDAMIQIACAIANPATPDDEVHRRCLALVESPHARVRAIAWYYQAHERENAGALTEAITATRRALDCASADDGPWIHADLHMMLASLHGQLGESDPAARHAEQALPMLERIGATDDAVQARLAIALAAIDRGDFEAARRDVADIEEAGRAAGRDRTGAVIMAQAQLAIADGHVEDGLALYRTAVEDSHAHRRGHPMDGENMLFPWVLATEATALAAEARYADGERGRDLFELLTGKVRSLLDEERPFIDYPVTGLIFFAAGMWALLRGALAPTDAIRLLVLAERFAYPRMSPPMRWEHVVTDAEALAPGVLEAVAAEYGERRAADLLPEARAAIERIVDSA